MKIKLVTGLPEAKELVNPPPDKIVKVPMLLEGNEGIVWIFEFKFSHWGRHYSYYTLYNIVPYVKKKYIIDKLTE